MCKSDTDSYVLKLPVKTVLYNQEIVITSNEPPPETTRTCKSFDHKLLDIPQCFRKSCLQECDCPKANFNEILKDKELFKELTKYGVGNSKFHKYLRFLN